MRMRSLLLAFVLLAGPAVAQDRTAKLLGELADAHGPPGFEEPVRAIMVRELKPLSDTIRYDGMGSVIATAGGSGPKIMLDAHMDEVGGMVRRIVPGGLLTMQLLGGFLDQVLIDKRWTIMGSKGPVTAVTGIRSVHTTSADDRSKVIARDMIFLDVGARTAAEVEALGIGPGDPVVPFSPFEILPGGVRYVGKAWDDRVGLVVMIEAMRRLKASGHPNQIFAAATVQEEIGLRGARTASDIIRPDIGIAIEAGVTGDMPGSPAEASQAKLGGGPGIFLYDSSTIPNRKFVALVKAVALEARIPLQLDLVQGYGDDSAAIQATNGGVPTVNLVVPARSLHAHNGMIDRGDFDQMVELVVALIRRLDAATVADLKDFAP